MRRESPLRLGDIEAFSYAGGAGRGEIVARVGGQNVVLAEADERTGEYLVRRLNHYKQRFSRE